MSRISTKSALNSFAETVESLIVAFVLAFIFRAFVVEAFVIPTGSMADTLQGAHFRLTCPTCAYEFNYDFSPTQYTMPNDPSMTYPKGYLPPYPVAVHPSKVSPLTGIPVCPMCGTVTNNSYRKRANNGDRILVMKYLYQFTEPKMWDVIVFKNPTEPDINYIKRLVGRPHEKIEIIDGDVYINDEIARKPRDIQDVLWIPTYAGDHQPTAASIHYNQHYLWPNPFLPKNTETAWQYQTSNIFTFKGSKSLDTLEFDTRRLNTILRCFHSYNGQMTSRFANAILPLVSDLKLEFYVTPTSEKGSIVISLGKYGRKYHAEINFNGSCTITEEFTGQTHQYQHHCPLQPNVPVKVAFANVDHQLQIQIDQDVFTAAGANQPEQWGYTQKTNNITPTVSITAQGEAFTIEHITLYRDNHYTNKQRPDTHGRATQGFALTLKDDQFFVLGDNSPKSHDSRFWEKPGLGLNKEYQPGIVPRDLLIGRALWVYWPAAYHLHPKIRYPFIPNAGEMRFIH